jgi:penicillin-binding protein 2
VAFAPRDNPKIAIAVVIENGGYGATWAAPIASLMIEKYIKGKTDRADLEKRMMEGDLLANVRAALAGAPSSVKLEKAAKGKKK